jgi:hypothetical protein
MGPNYKSAEVPVLPTLSVPVTVDGCLYHFLLDTGCTISIVGKSLSNKLVPTSQTVSAGFPHGTVMCRIFHLRSASVGKLELPLPEPVMCMDLQNFWRALGREYQGVLGMSFLRKHIVRLDFDRREVQLLAASDHIAGEHVPIYFNRIKVPEVVVEFAGLGRSRFMVDTGFFFDHDGMVDQSLLNALREKHLGRNLGDRRIPDVSLVGVRYETKGMHSVDTLSLGALAVQHVSLRQGFKNVLGLAFWRRFNVVFYLPNQRMYLQERKVDRGALVESK